MKNEYMPFPSQIKEVIRHTPKEYTFRMAYTGNSVPGQFFEVSLPKYGEAPISISGIDEGTIDLTIRKVGTVTGEVFENYVDDVLLLRGPYGNGFHLEDYKGHELIVIAGGTGLAPVRGVIQYFASHPSEVKNITVVAGFKTLQDVLFKEDIEKWRELFHVLITVDTAPDDYTGLTGRVTNYIPKLKINDLNDAHVIIAGPIMMMKAAAEAILERGIKEEHIWISHERRMSCGIGKCGHCRID